MKTVRSVHVPAEIRTRHPLEYKSGPLGINFTPLCYALFVKCGSPFMRFRLHPRGRTSVKCNSVSSAQWWYGEGSRSVAPLSPSLGTRWRCST